MQLTFGLNSSFKTTKGRTSGYSSGAMPIARACMPYFLLVLIALRPMRT